MYSKGGTPGNLSTMLNDMGIGGPITEYLDSTEFDSETEMAMKNVIEGVAISKLMQLSWAAGSKGIPELNRYMKEYQPKAQGLPGTQKGMVAFHGSGAKQAVANRGVKGDDLLNTEDLIEELQGVGAIISDDGMVTAYHRTSKENAENIYRTGTMTAKEPDIFFSTSIDSEYGKGFGDDYVAVEIPVEQLRLDDVFPGKDASVSIPVKGKIGTPVKVKVLKRNEEKVK